MRTAEVEGRGRRTPLTRPARWLPAHRQPASDGRCRPRECTARSRCLLCRACGQGGQERRELSTACRAARRGEAHASPPGAGVGGVGAMAGRGRTPLAAVAPMHRHSPIVVHRLVVAHPASSCLLVTKVLRAHGRGGGRPGWWAEPGSRRPACPRPPARAHQTCASLRKQLPPPAAACARPCLHRLEDVVVQRQARVVGPAVGRGPVDAPAVGRQSKVSRGEEGVVGVFSDAGRESHVGNRLHPPIQRMLQGRRRRRRRQAQPASQHQGQPAPAPAPAHRHCTERRNASAACTVC